MGLLAKASVAIDGSKFKVVNNRDRNFTRGKVDRRRAQLEESLARYLSQLDTADRQEPSDVLVLKTTRLKEKLDKLKEEMGKLAAYEKQMLASPDGQISLTDPDSRSMATSGRGSGVVGYNVQVAVDTVNHLIVTHEVTNTGSDRSQLANVARQAKAVLQVDKLEAVADRGYFNGEEILACEQADICVTLPKPMTSGAKLEGRFGKQDFVYLPDEDVYRCPAAQRLKYSFTAVEHGQKLHRYIQRVDKAINHTNGIALLDPLIKALRQQRRLSAIGTLNEALHELPPANRQANHSREAVFTQPGSLAVLLSAASKSRWCPLRALVA